MSETRTHPPHASSRPKSAGIIGSLALVGTVAGVTLAAHAAAAGPGGSASPATTTRGTAQGLSAPLYAADNTGRRRADAAAFDADVQWSRAVTWDSAVKRATLQREAAEERAADQEAADQAAAEQAAAEQAASEAQSQAQYQASQTQSTASTSYAVSSSSESGSVESTLACIRSAESGGNYGAVNSSTGAGGAYQFMPSTWAALGGTGSPEDASASEQDAIAMKAYDTDGWAPWSGDGCV